MSECNESSTGELHELSELGVQVMDQSALEQTVQNQARRDMASNELEVQQKRLLRSQIALDKKNEMLRRTRDTISKTAPTTVRYQSAMDKAGRLEDEISQVKADVAEIEEHIRQIQTGAEELAVCGGVSIGHGLLDDERASGQPSVTHDGLVRLLVPKRRAAIAAEQKRQVSFQEDIDVESDTESDSYMPPPLPPPPPPASSGDTKKSGGRDDQRGKAKRKLLDSESEDASYNEGSDDQDDVVDIEELATDDELGTTGSIVIGRPRPNEADTFDDGNELLYQQRILGWCVSRWRARQVAEGNVMASTADIPEDLAAYIEVDGQHIPRAQMLEEPFLDDPDTPDYKIKAHDRGKPSLRVPRQIWDKLLEYQKAALRWMFTLHQQNAGGILGDEMGLGKTVQVAAFLASMYHSHLLSQPSIVVCPATLMRQWVREFHTWWPMLRVVILHSTGYAMRVGGLAADEGIFGQEGDNPGDLGHSLTSNLPANTETAIWDAAREANPRFASRIVDDSDEFQLNYDSTDDYEYDAYGSRIRRKRRPRGYVDWKKKQQQQGKKKKVRHTGMSQASTASLRHAGALVDHVQRHGHIVIVTYSGLQVYQKALLGRQWGYAVLDEGHMIRNPDAEATLACKRLDTRHRILVTGTPIQNGLTELWSLFDFIFPGRLGTLPVFNNQFTVPITVGGYASASALQVRAAYRCACILRDLIDPYLLRRLKADVARDLPHKTEQVLFCRLTPMQRSAYKSFLTSGDMERILLGKLQMLFGVDVARKICDHPDLLLLSTMPSAHRTHNMASAVHAAPQTAISSNGNEADNGADASGTTGALPPDYGDWRKSGKLTIVRALLQMWKPRGHKVLIFCQTRQMLDIIERMVSAMPNINYRRMDGKTPVQNRTALVDEYNRDKHIFVFLLTTRVGGLGINLTGADRVILYSPDWNPSSDMQARERAWRLGQTRDVAIYRLMTAGTIEEKIYNRQIYKQFLSNKILSDPKQKRFFHSQTLQDLFSLAGFNDGGPDEDENQDAGNPALSSAVSASGTTGSARINSTMTGRMFADAQLFPKPDSDDDEAGNNNADPSASASKESISVDGDGANAIDSIVGVERLEEYRPASETDAEDNATSAADGTSGRGSGESSKRTPEKDKTYATSGEDRVLQSLFKMSGVVHSALKHDAIVNSSSRDDEDVHAIEQQADRIAHEARMALRESQRSRRQVDVRVPTWTGSSGQAGIPTANDQTPGAGRVAPPPSAILGTRLPPKAQELQRQQEQGRLLGLHALGKSRYGPPPPPAASSSRANLTQDSLIYNSDLTRRAVLDRALPSSNIVASLSMSHSQTPKFGSHLVAGMHRANGSSSSSVMSSAGLLAGLKARSVGAVGATTATTSSPQFLSGRISRPTDSTDGSRNFGAAARSPNLSNVQSRPHGTRPLLPPGNTGSGRGLLADSAVAATSSTAPRMARPAALSDSDKAIVERIRSTLIQSGGEMTNKSLVDAFRSEFSLTGLPKLRQLAETIADLESRQPTTSSKASQIGIGRVVQKMWKLRDKR
ncbi:SNF2 family N-terminal domain-containing protein [Kickxella alabastrina]|uniref:SNF2 family N-terminal domain-containing protein n=1 Tax=Kickxella alabastrina TaxID=61397 RepID=UPI00221EBED2|nr:SNF2 family N-terminal domain-containing protein [Kickxella alabastrina]KAI7834243.1 SNF2 family N-terminal domain-containing protein [Kickxella alabastrina]